MTKIGRKEDEDEGEDEIDMEIGDSDACLLVTERWQTHPRKG